MSDKPLAYIDSDGALTIRASASGKCVRALWAALEEIQPMSPSEKLEDIFEEGHLHEAAVKQVLESEGAEIDDQAEVTYWVLAGKVKIVGHLDGDILNWNQIWENKALGKAGFQRYRNVGFDAYPEYAWQISVYMYATGKPALYTVKSRDSGELDRKIIDKAPISETEIKMKALTLYSTWKDGIMPACDPERWGCPFFFLHDETKEAMVVELEDPYIEALAGTLRDVRLAKKELDEKESELKEEILKEVSVGKHVVGLYELSIRKQTSRRLDQGLLIEDGIDPDKYKKESNPYPVIEVKEKK